MIQQSLGSFCCLRSDWVSSQFFSEHKIQQQIINFNNFFIKPEEVMFENEGKNHKQSSFILLVLCRTQDSSAVYKSIYDESSPVRCSAAGSVRLAHSWTSFNLSAVLYTPAEKDLFNIPI